ncbi:hypothetical protein UPYG_G00206130 [Umbra pygmaea]|uniref:SGNH hydrolase-type esterase domain-containing protein n=1 Tax=Umbra pygmaea TaxID=75934 RepID=A0ABD0X371_UMBPY
MTGILYQYGSRHVAKNWPHSKHNPHPKRHRLLLPREKDILSGRKFVMVVGDSHLRAFVDNITPIGNHNDSSGKEALAFGFMSTPGARASHLMADVRGEVLPKGLVPDMVCLIAPGNNLEASLSIAQAGEEFRQLLLAVKLRWTNVFVLDFPRRIDGKKDQRYQELLAVEYETQAGDLGVIYRREMTKDSWLEWLCYWCPDKVHLSDDFGMPRMLEMFVRLTRPVSPQMDH